MGFDEESKGHRIYWVEKRSVTVERSVKFMPEEVGIGGVPLEGELEDFDEPEEPEASDNPIPIENDIVRPLSPIPEAVVNQVINNVPSQLAQPVVAADVDSGRGKRIRICSAHPRRRECNCNATRTSDSTRKGNGERIWGLGGAGRGLGNGSDDGCSRGFKPHLRGGKEAVGLAKMGGSYLS